MLECWPAHIKPNIKQASKLQKQTFTFNWLKVMSSLGNPNSNHQSIPPPVGSILNLSFWSGLMLLNVVVQDSTTVSLNWLLWTTLIIRSFILDSKWKSVDRKFILSQNRLVKLKENNYYLPKYCWMEKDKLWWMHLKMQPWGASTTHCSFYCLSFSKVVCVISFCQNKCWVDRLLFITNFILV